MGITLNQKISIGISIIVIITMATVMTMGTVATTRAIEQKIREDMLVAYKVFGYFQQNHFRELLGVNQIAAQIPQLRAVVATPGIDHATILDSLREVGAITQSNLFMITDAGGKLLASVTQPERFGDDLSKEPAFRKALDGEDFTGVWALPQGIYQVTASPFLIDGEVVGVLLSGYAVDRGVIDQLAKMIHCEVALITPHQSIVSSLANPHLDRLGAAGLLPSPAGGSLPATTATPQILIRPLEKERYMLLNVPLAPEREKGYYLLARSLDRELDFFHRLQLGLLLAGCFILTGALLFGVVYSGRITRPIKMLLEGIRRLTAGDMTSRMTVSTGGDEIGRLAHEFNTLARNLHHTTVSKDFVNSIISNMNNSLIVLTPEMEIKLVNETTRALLGYREEDLLGRPFDMIFTGSSRDISIRSRLKKLGDKEVVRNEDLTYLAKDGHEIPVLFSAASMKDNANKITGLVCVAQDITERKEMENKLTKMNRDLLDREKALRSMFKDLHEAHENLKQAQQQMLQSEKMASVGQLAAGVAHEINNPVGFISNNMTILVQYITDYTKVLKMADRLRESVAREDLVKAKSIVEEMNKLKEEISLDYVISDMDKLLRHNLDGIERVQKIVYDLRTFAREDASEMEHVKIEEVIEGILTIVYSEIKYKAKLEKDYGDTPPIECNPQKLGQVFINLIINALHAIAGSGTIAIKTCRQGEFVHVDVRDTGKGIPPENLNKIFDPFFTTKPLGQGTGLGLSVSYEIIKKHNGRMTARSKVGEGTTFTIVLPITQEKWKKP